MCSIWMSPQTHLETAAEGLWARGAAVHVPSSAFLLVLLHLVGLKNSRRGDPQIANVRGDLCSLSSTRLPKLLNYHNNSAAAVFAGGHMVQKSIRRRFTADLHIMMPTLPIINIPFSSLNGRYLSFFFCLFLEKGWRGWAGERNLDSAALIPLSGLVIGVYMIGFYSVPINPCQSKVGLARYQASRDKKSNSSTTVNIP